MMMEADRRSDVYFRNAGIFSLRGEGSSSKIEGNR
jgi:hypothetical protein